jgi:hypothetical protein
MEADEAGTLVARGGARSPAIVSVWRYSLARRLVPSVTIAVVGTAAGIVTVVVPIMHFMTLWLVPLLSIGTAIWLYRCKARVRLVTALCPVCSGQVAAGGGDWEEPMWVRCRACNAPLELRLERPV